MAGTARPATGPHLDLTQPNEDVLDRVEHSLGLRLDRTSRVLGVQGRTAGYRSNRDTWVRIDWRPRWRIYGPAWIGAESASVLRGVAKPD